LVDARNATINASEGGGLKPAAGWNLSHWRPGAYPV